MVFAEGEVRRLHWSARAVFDGQGNVVELQSVGHEVAQESADADAVAESRELTAS